MKKPCTVQYSTLFIDDMLQIKNYITQRLHNPDAANRLIDEVEQAILKRSLSPESFEPFRSARARKHCYYRIYVKNYVVFYIVIGDIMEVRRFVYMRRNVDEIAE